MAVDLPPDPYRLLGVAKDAKLPEIRSAHRKLVLKCHPDKVQDPALKAIKQDEFQKVQQAYEILSDDTKRVQYDEQVHLFELRRQMGKGNPTPRSNPFEFEVRTEEPRPSTHTRPAPGSAPARPQVYTNYAAPRSHEDIYEVPPRTAKKSTSYESNDARRRATTREGERERNMRRQEEDDRVRERYEKEKKSQAHGEKKKSRDKEKRRGTEEKHSRSQPYVEEDSDDYRATREKKSSRHREEESRIRPEEPRAYKSPHISPTAPSAPMTPKWDTHKEFASEYMMAARQKHVPKSEEFKAPPLRRAETDLRYNVRYAPPQSHHMSPTSEDDASRRPSARRQSEDPVSRSRKPSEDTGSRSSRDPKKEAKRSPSSRTRDAYIVEPPSPPIPSTKPKLQTHTSAPPIIPASYRDKPSRSKTHDYPRQDPMPPLPRAQTFQSGDRDHGRSREKGGSRLKSTVNYDSDSDSDAPVFVSRASQSPQRRREAPSEEIKTRYFVNNGRIIPAASRHREEMRNIDEESKYARDRSESPRGGRAAHTHTERPPLARNSGGSHSSTSTRQPPQRSQSQAYYPEVIPEIRNVRPKMPARADAHYFGEVKFAEPLRAEHVQYSSHGNTEQLRRGSDPNHNVVRDYPTYPTTERGAREAVY